MPCFTCSCEGELPASVCVCVCACMRALPACVRENWPACVCVCVCVFVCVCMYACFTCSCEGELPACDVAIRTEFHVKQDVSFYPGRFR